MIEIVPAQKEDLILVREIAHKTWPDTFGEVLSPEQISYMLNWMYSLETLEKQMDEGHHFFLAKSEEIPLGFTGIQANYEPHKIKIHKIYILPEAQGKGIGKLLFAQIKKTALENQQSHLLLNVNQYNQPAINFYQRYGFYEIRREVINIGQGYVMDDIVFEFKL
ncbi:GNAT family N-acetyltransferase [Algoriphagus vanfongensis]|uniref:GNAT family N-acetyltransferase n=1 Tax=Algoriphagus vanfongensis TaxID=426371 RepID=UPI000413BC32|nr:GNAT family N-acetyltransferase [Algoriphagus vanfongensis]